MFDNYDFSIIEMTIRRLQTFVFLGWSDDVMGVSSSSIWILNPLQGMGLLLCLPFTAGTRRLPVYPTTLHMYVISPRIKVKENKHTYMGAIVCGKSPRWRTSGLTANFICIIVSFIFLSFRHNLLRVLSNTAIVTFQIIIILQNLILNYRIKFRSYWTRFNDIPLSSLFIYSLFADLMP